MSVIAEVEGSWHPRPEKQDRDIRILKPGWRAEGRLVAIEEHGDDQQIVFIYAPDIDYTFGILLPLQRFRTKGGTVDLRDWLGHVISLRNSFGIYSTRMMPLNPLQLRVWELEEVLAHLIEAHACHRDASAGQQEALQILGLKKNFTLRDLQKFNKATVVKEARRKAENAVIEVEGPKRRKA